MEFGKESELELAIYRNFWDLLGERRLPISTRKHGHPDHLWICSWIDRQVQLCEAGRADIVFYEVGAYRRENRWSPSIAVHVIELKNVEVSASDVAQVLRYRQFMSAALSGYMPTEGWVSVDAVLMGPSFKPEAIVLASEIPDNLTLAQFDQDLMHGFSTKSMNVPYLGNPYIDLGYQRCEEVAPDWMASASKAFNPRSFLPAEPAPKMRVIPGGAA